MNKRECEDAISRQAVLDVVENSCLDLGEYEDTEAFCYMIRSLPLVTPTQNWIPVSERLPEKGVEVLATTEWGEVTIAMYCVTDWLIHEGDTNAETDDIIAWMPLPESYKESEEE